MKIGKLSESIRKRSVLKYIKTNRDEVKKGASLYSDCAFFQLKNEENEDMNGANSQILSSVQTMSLPTKEAGRAAIYAAVNAIFSQGGDAFAVLLSLTLPETMEEKELQEWIKSIEEVCKVLKVQIATCHAEVTGNVTCPVVSVTALGKQIQFKHDNGEEMKKDMKQKSTLPMSIVMTKWAGMEGTWLLAKAKEKELLTRYPYALVRDAYGLEEALSVREEATIAYENGAILVHDLRNGGVFGGLWELSNMLQEGICVDLKKIPIRQETIEVTEFFGLNPYELLSGGSLLIAVQNGEALIEKMHEMGIPAEIIGQTTDNNDKIILNEDETRYLDRTKQDEIYRAHII